MIQYILLFIAQLCKLLLNGVLSFLIIAILFFTYEERHNDYSLYSLIYASLLISLMITLNTDDKNP